MRTAGDQADIALNVAARVVVGANREEASELTLAAGVGLEAYGVVAGDLAEHPLEALDERDVSLGLVQRCEGVNAREARPRDGLHLRGRIEFHGA